MKYTALLIAFCWTGLAQSADKCSIAGTVLNAVSGEPVKKAIITVLPSGVHRQNSPAQNVVTDAGGRFLVDNLDPGAYLVLAGRNGFVDQWYGAKVANQPSGTVLTLEPGAKRSDIDIRMLPQGTVSGRVLDEDGDPMVLVTVQLQKYIYNRGRKEVVPAASGSTNDLGEYRIFGVSPGTYYLVARAPESFRQSPAQAVAYPPAYHPNSSSIDSAAPLKIGAGTQLQNIDIALSRSHGIRIRGRVVDAEGKPLPNAGVFLVARDASGARGDGPLRRESDG